MNDQHHPPIGVAVDRAVGRVAHWTDKASRDELEDYCRHAEDDLRARDAEIDRLRAEAEALRKEKQGLLDMQAAIARLRRRLEEKSPRGIEGADLLGPNAPFSGGRSPSAGTGS